MVDKIYRSGFLAAFLAFLAGLAPPSAWAGSLTQPLITEKLPALADCAVIPDSELSNIRGRNGSYYFGLDIIVNLTGTGAPVTLIPSPNNTPGTINTGTGISFSDPNVNYKAGIGSQSLYQMVQVGGNRNIVRGVVNLDIMVPKSLLNGRLRATSIPRVSPSGLF